MKQIKIIILILFSSIAYSQKTIQILDSLSNLPIEYATVKFLGTEKGDYSNDKGIVTIPKGIKKIKVSSIGYFKKEIYTLKDTILLQSKTISLNEFELIKPEVKQIGKQKSKIEIGFSSYSESVIFAKKIYISENSFINKAFFKIINDSKNRKYRFLIYNTIKDKDSKQIPNENILNKNIISEIKSNSVETNLNLSLYNITLSKGFYFIAIEIFDLSRIKNKSPIKIGCYKTSKKGESLSKPVFNDLESWRSIKTFNKKKEYAFNFYLEVKQ